MFKSNTMRFHRMCRHCVTAIVLLHFLSPVLGEYSVHQCSDLGSVRQRGACRLGGCLDNEYRLPGEGICDVRSSLWAVFLCVDSFPCCARGGACRYACTLGEQPVNAGTDCTASGAQCCVLGEDTRMRTRESVAKQQGACGRILALGPRIIGGSVTQPDNWPWMARLINTARPGQGICAGVLVDDDTVLTVAHCVSGIGTQDLQVLLGDFDITVTDPEEELVDVSSIEVNPNFVLGFRGNDFAVLKLAKPVTFTARKLPACIPDPDIPIVGGALGADDILRGRGSEPDIMANHCFIAGWGRTRFGQVSPQLRTAPVLLMDTASCNSAFNAVSGDFNSYLPSDILCTNTAATNTDACLFDDGGMLVCLDVKNRYSLVGLVTEYSCGRLPTLYTRVSNYTLPVLARL